jgi:hypothetical protein
MGATLDQLRRMSGTIAGAAVSAAAAALLTPQVLPRLRVPSWLLLLTASIGAAITVNEPAGKPIPFLRWSVLTMALRGRHLLTEGQVATVGKRRSGNTSYPTPASVMSTTRFESSMTSAGTSAFSSM